MMKNDADRSNDSKIRITTPRGNIEINWPKNQRPGFCPHCHKRIPLSSIVFKKVNGDSTEIFSGLDAAIAGGYIKPDGESADYSGQVGECPYCHQPISVREIVVSTGNDQERKE